MMSTQPFGMDDIIFAFKNQLACRHISDEKSYLSHFSQIVHGDAYAIGAAHIFTYTPEQRANTAVLHKAIMERIIEAFKGGPKDLDVIKAKGEAVITLYKAEIRKMVAQAVGYDDRHTEATNCHFIFYKNLSSVMTPYDIGKYAFGKCGKRELDPNNVCGGIFLEEDEILSLRGNTEKIIDRLTEKLLMQLQTLRSREHMKGPDQEHTAQQH